MKRFLGWVLVVIIAIAAAYYFLPAAAWQIIPKNFLAPLGTKKIGLSGSGIVSSSSLPGLNTQSVIPAPLSALIEHPQKTVQAGAAAVLDYAKATLQNETTQLLNLAPAQPSSSSNATSSAPSATTFQVCSLEKLSASVEYQIISPFAAGVQFSYAIDWGDGATSKGTSNETNSTITHHYLKTGTYLITFLVRKTDGDLATQRTVCVQ